MDEQSVLPFHDMPIARSNRVNVIDQSSRKKIQPYKSVAPGVASALADSTRVVFLDVETTGLSWYYDDITIVGWMRGGRYDFHIAGEYPTRLADALRHAAALVTFNGTLFDLRFLRKAFIDDDGRYVGIDHGGAKGVFEASDKHRLIDESVQWTTQPAPFGAQIWPIRCRHASDDQHLEVWTM